VDSAGNAYVGGSTLSANLPVTPGAYQTTPGSGFVAKINVAAPSFAVTGFPSPTTAGTAGTFTVTAQDANGNTLTGYTGTVHFTSSDSQAVLPADYTFTAADQGSHTFSATLKTAGSQSIYATDTTTAMVGGGQLFIHVNPAAATHFSISGPSSIAAGTAFGLRSRRWTPTATSPRTILAPSTSPTRSVAPRCPTTIPSRARTPACIPSRA
jgi:hypothetical protein